MINGPPPEFFAVLVPACLLMGFIFIKLIIGKPKEEDAPAASGSQQKSNDVKAMRTPRGRLKPVRDDLVTDDRGRRSFPDFKTANAEREALRAKLSSKRRMTDMEYEVMQERLNEIEEENQYRDIDDIPF